MLEPHSPDPVPELLAAQAGSPLLASHSQPRHGMSLQNKSLSMEGRGLCLTPD